MWRLNQGPKLEQLCRTWAERLRKEFELDKFALPDATSTHYEVVSMGPHCPAHVQFEFVFQSLVHPCSNPVQADLKELIGHYAVVPGGFTVVIREAFPGNSHLYHRPLESDGETSHHVGAYLELELVCEIFDPVPIDPALIPDIRTENNQSQVMKG